MTEKIRGFLPPVKSYKNSMDLGVLSHFQNEPECFCHNEIKYVALIIASGNLSSVILWGVMLVCL